MELLAPDGYYTYLRIPKPAASSAAAGSSSEEPAIDVDAVKKNYRKLSLRHHPDKGGDVDTFRLLKRAQTVLSNAKLRQQYDILSLDLDDDEHEHDDDNEHSAGVDDDGKELPSVSQGIVQEMAQTVLTGIIQMGVRIGE